MLTYKRVLLGVFVAAFAPEAIAATRWALETAIGLGSSQAAEALVLRGAAAAINAALIYAFLVVCAGVWRRWRERQLGAAPIAAAGPASADPADGETLGGAPGEEQLDGGSNGHRC